MATAFPTSDYFHKTETNPSLEAFSIIWLDANVNGKHIRDTEQKLRSTNNRLKKFEDVTKCQKYIEGTSQRDRLVLIVSGRLGREIVPFIHEIRQIISIYIYCMDKAAYKKWSENFVKIKAVVVELDELIVRIKADHRIQKKVEEPWSIQIFTTVADAGKSTNGVNGQFVFSQVLLDCLLRLKFTEADKNELIDCFKNEYKNNEYELKNIREFERNYKPDAALCWYSRESFFYKTLNAALRKQEIHMLYLYRSFINDIYLQLKNNQAKQPIYAYRGQMMSSEELNILRRCRDQFISINSFFSTSSNYHGARRFLQSLNAPGNLEAVLFEIAADPKVASTKPFADISKYSEFPQETEVLFMLGSIFRLDSIDRNSDDPVWIIRMTLCSDDDHNLKQVLADMKEQLGSGHTNLQTFGKLLWNMGKPELAKKYFLNLLNQLPPSDPLVLDLYLDLANLASQARELDKSMEWRKKALQFKEKNYKSTSTSIKETNNSTNSSTKTYVTKAKPKKDTNSSKFQTNTNVAAFITTADTVLNAPSEKIYVRRPDPPATKKNFDEQQRRSSKKRISNKKALTTKSGNNSSETYNFQNIQRVPLKPSLILHPLPPQLLLEQIFINGVWLHRYYQYGLWYGPYQQRITFNTQNNMLDGNGSDNIGQFILSGTYSKHNRQINMIQAYQTGTGNSKLNIGHRCRYELTWNKEKRIFQGPIYVTFEETTVEDGLYEMWSTVSEP
ncbi:unnamed protein product, partial [Rotaria magnacalcarata]